MEFTLFERRIWFRVLRGKLREGKERKGIQKVLELFKDTVLSTFLLQGPQSRMKTIIVHVLHDELDYVLFRETFPTGLTCRLEYTNKP